MHEHPSIQTTGRRTRFRRLVWIILAVVLSVAIVALSWTVSPSIKYTLVEKEKLKKQDETIITDDPSVVTSTTISSQQQQPHDETKGEQTNDDVLANYTTINIINTTWTLFYHAPRVLIFTGTHKFRAYTLAQNNTMPREHLSGRRSEFFIPLLVDALLTHFSERFSPNSSPPFQLVFTTADVSYSTCTFQNCTTMKMAPWINAGSTFRDDTLVPGLEMFPNDARMECLWHWRRTRANCTTHLYDASKIDWSDLYPTVIWRGSAYPFLHFWDWQQNEGKNEWILTRTSTNISNQPITPRQRCVDLARQAERRKETAPTDPSRLWIDCRYTTTTQLSRMSPQQMLRYRYQIDLGGLGGTTWAGTLQKLSFPGLLLHHETPAQDWFYPRLKPWVHYVPIQTDLSDLRAKYDWAEAHPEEAEEIARAGTAFVKDLMSSETVREEYERYFVRSLGRYVKAYQPAKGETLDAILKQYEQEGFEVEQFSECNQTHCATNLGGEQGVHVESLVL